MADVITRFKLETSQYDSKLRDASKGLSAYSKQAEMSGKEFAKFTQKSVEAAKSLGTIATSANNTKDKLKELVGAYNDVAKAYNSLTEEQRNSDFAKAMAQSLQTLQSRIKETKDELYSLKDVGGKGGGLFGGDKISGMLQVFGGNLMTKAAGMAAGLATELGDAVKQGIELAKQGEGVRIAFERLGRGDILDGLRQATHGTVTDLELMKAAVKFNDFKLPLDELGTMLAFAQQKAKDTGQSVDYMVDSIVTGLGRKSLMILDNLGLSANEVKEKMKETGDMTKAVGAIIREQMSKAGDYVETAADRAAQANVSLQNKMEELGRKFAPVEEASSQLWTSMKIGILDIISGPLATLINQLTEAGRLKNMLNSMNGESGSGNTKVDQQLKKLKVIKAGGGSDYIFNSTLNGMMEDYNRQIMALDTQIKNGGKKPGARSGESQDVRYLQQKMDALKIMRDQLAAGAKEINKPIKIDTNIPFSTGSGSGKGGSGGGKGTTKTEQTEMQTLQKQIQELEQEYIKLGGITTDEADKRRSEINAEIAANEKRIGQIKLLNEQAHGRLLGGNVSTEGIKVGNIAFDAASLQNNLDYVLEQIKIKPIVIPIETVKKDVKDLQETAKTTASIVGTIGQAFNAIEDPAAKVAAVVAQAIANIALAYSDALAKDSSSKFNIWSFLAASAASMVSMATAISQIHSATGYAQGGMVKGNTYSGDQIPIMANAGEVVLTKAQQGNLASQLQGSGLQNIRLDAYVTGEQIRLVTRNTGRRTNSGETLSFKNG